MKAKAKKISVALIALLLVATVSHATAMLGVSVFWSSIVSGLAGTIGGHIQNYA